MGVMQTIWRSVADMIWPPSCFSCGASVGQQGELCAACFSDLSFITQPYCACCGTPFAHDMGPEALCGSCVQHKPAFDQARAALVYDEASRTMMIPFKNGKTLGAKRLAAWMGQAAYDALDDADLVMAVPLHRQRLQQRGYNQAVLLARWLAKLKNIPLHVDVLERVKNTPKQKGLSRAQRARNVKGAFAVAEGRRGLIAGRHVILVDDVITTGATIEAASRALKKAGARRVTVLSVARALVGE